MATLRQQIPVAGCSEIPQPTPKLRRRVVCSEAPPLLPTRQVEACLAVPQIPPMPVPAASLARPLLLLPRRAEGCSGAPQQHRLRRVAVCSVPSRNKRLFSEQAHHLQGTPYSVLHNHSSSNKHHYSGSRSLQEDCLVVAHWEGTAFSGLRPATCSRRRPLLGQAPSRMRRRSSCSWHRRSRAFRQRGILLHHYVGSR